ncbi:MAG: nitrilase-related carbon-nitrogen hydrolase, partial [Anaerovoracaceae bacterium]
MKNLGMITVAAVSPTLKLGNPLANAEEIISCVEEAAEDEVAVLVFPQRSITGVSCGDLFLQSKLYEDQLEALQIILEQTKKINMAFVLGIYIKIGKNLIDAAAFIQKGKIKGIVQKRNFSGVPPFAGSETVEDREQVNLLGKRIPFGDLIFADIENNIRFGIAVGEDFLAPISYSATLAIGGADIILNPTAEVFADGYTEMKELALSIETLK